MESNNLFKIVLLNHPASRNVFVRTQVDSLLLFGYAKDKIHISKFNLRNDIITDKTHEFDGETLLHNQIVVSVFTHNEKYYGVDQKGGLFFIEQQSTIDGNVEYDLFEDSPERVEKWNIVYINQIVVESCVLNTCLTYDGQLALLTSSQTCVSLELINISSGEKAKSFVIREPGILQIHNKQECLLEWIPKEKIVDEFYTSWFKEGRENTGFFLVTLPDGNILAVFPDSGEVEHLYVWFSPFVASLWDFSHNQGECGVRLVSSCGGVVSLTEIGELRTSYLPTKPKALCHLADYLYFSDWKDSYRLELSSQQLLSLPLKGVLCWSAWGSVVLGVGRNGQVYAIDNNYRVKEDTQELLPDSSLTAELIRKNAAFQQVNAEIAQTDRYIRAILLTKKDIKFSLTAQMLTVGGEECRVCLVMKCLSPDVVMERKDWELSLSLGGEGGTLTSCHKLRESLASQALSQVFSFRSRRPSRLLLRVRLFFSHLPPQASYLPVLHIGKIEMDPSYFLLPGIELETEYVPDDPDLSPHFLSGLPGFSGSKVEEKEDIKLSVKLSENYPQDSVFRNLLKNSKALWRTSQWDKACAGDKLELAVRNKLVKLELSGGSVTISGEDADSCYLVKEALFATSPHTSRLRLQPHHAQLLQTYAASSEVLAHMEDPPIEKLEELRNLIRENITSNIIP